MVDGRHEPIPTPEVMEYQGDVPTAFADLSAFSPLGSAAAPSVAASADAPLAWQKDTGSSGLEPHEVERFRALMAAAHWPVHVPRMLTDRKYACDRMVLAQASANPQLRALAQGLFKAMQARTRSH
jgi:hypothetical protein